MWQSYFLMGWEHTGAFLALFLGGLAAVLLALLALAVVLLALVAVLSVMFDRITRAMAKHWEKKGKRPAYRWAEIIARGRRHEE